MGHDHRFKELLRLFLHPFLEFFFPDIARQLDLSIRSTFLVPTLSRRRTVAHLFRAARALKGLRRLRSTRAVLDRGYRALRPIDEIRPFVVAMKEGESRYLERVFGS